MKTYSHDYTNPYEAEVLLYIASWLIANEYYDSAAERINEAKNLLLRYLTQDNTIEDEDAADGWVKMSEITETGIIQ